MTKIVAFTPAEILIALLVFLALVYAVIFLAKRLGKVEDELDHQTALLAKAGMRILDLQKEKEGEAPDQNIRSEGQGDGPCLN